MTCRPHRHRHRHPCRYRAAECAANVRTRFEVRGRERSTYKNIPIISDKYNIYVRKKVDARYKWERRVVSTPLVRKILLSSRNAVLSMTASGIHRPSRVAFIVDRVPLPVSLPWRFSFRRPSSRFRILLNATATSTAFDRVRMYDFTSPTDRARITASSIARSSLAPFASRISHRGSSKCEMASQLHICTRSRPRHVRYHRLTRSAELFPIFLLYRCERNYNSERRKSREKKKKLPLLCTVQVDLNNLV